MALAFLARNGGIVNNGARRDFTLTRPPGVQSTEREFFSRLRLVPHC